MRTKNQASDNLGRSTLIKRQTQMHKLVPGQKEGIMGGREIGTRTHRILPVTDTGRNLNSKRVVSPWAWYLLEGEPTGLLFD